MKPRKRKKRRITPRSKIDVLLPEQKQATELRREQRKAVNFPICTLEGGGLNEWLVNYRSTGCCFTSMATLKMGDLTTVDLRNTETPMGPKSDRYKMGIVVWDQKEGYGQRKYGVEICSWLCYN